MSHCSLFLLIFFYYHEAIHKQEKNMAERIHATKLMGDNAGVVSLEYLAEIQQVVKDTLTAWQAFINLPQAAKDTLASSNSHDGVGYEKKVGAGESRDIKENFDITIRGVTSLEEFHKGTDSPKAVQQLLAHCALLARTLRPMQLAYGDYISSTIQDGGAFLDTLKQSADEVFIRLLSYPPSPLNSEVGEAHTDHSGFTIHLAETCGGCEALDTQGTWQPLPIEEGRATAFGSMQTQLATRGVIKALCHRIVATAETTKNGRLAIVAFTPLKDIPSYDREAHGRLQEKQPGFNYDMSRQDFAQLFEDTR